MIRRYRYNRHGEVVRDNREIDFHTPGEKNRPGVIRYRAKSHSPGWVRFHRIRTDRRVSVSRG